MEMTVRRAELGDVSALIANVIAVADESEGTKLDSDVVAQGVQAIFEKPEFGFYIVAELEDRVVGSLMISYEWSDWRNGVYWWIQSAYVHQDVRGQGVYRAMYSFIKNEISISDNVRGLYLYAESGNSNARAAYEKLGMKQSSCLIYHDKL